MTNYRPAQSAVIRYHNLQASPQILNGQPQRFMATHRPPVPQINIQTTQIRAPIQAQAGPQGLPLKPPPLVMQKPNHPPTAFGKARNVFEFKVYGALEVSHQIINKINILTNQSSYRNVRGLKDLKELYIHLTYLLTYAQGRFKVRKIDPSPFLLVQRS